jgi:DNA helicase-2/ATP-dependent DNA helicase PcrA
MRLLTGPRWRIGPRDLETLGEWAAHLRRQSTTPQTTPDRDHAVLHADVPGPADAAPADAAPADADPVLPDAVKDRSIIDALDMLHPPSWSGPHGRGFSSPGYQRLTALSRELRRLRRRTNLPLAELVSEVERALLLDVELAAVPGTSPAAARAQLDAFTDVAAGCADSADRATLCAFLAWLTAAEKRERGLQQAEEADDDVSLAPEGFEPSRTAVQLLTVHASKGLEWDVSAVPGLVEGSFPSGKTSQGQDSDTGWLTGLGPLPYDLRGDRDSLPTWHWRAATHLKELEEATSRFKLDCGAHQEAEERRLAYVAATRARRILLLSGAWWGDAKGHRKPSRYLREVADSFGDDPLVGVQGLAAEQIDAGPEQPENPRLAAPERKPWPYDPLGARRPTVEAAAAAVLSALNTALNQDADTQQHADAHPSEWSAEVERLLAERAASSNPIREVDLPVHLSASRVVQLAADPAALAEQIRRPMPTEPRPQTRRGTAFHAWLEERFRAETLVDLWDLPGASDEDAAPDEELPRLKETFLASEWAGRTPEAVEVDVETPVAGVVLRGRIDAVFRRPDGGYDVVDWKTGRPPTGDRLRAAAMQLAVYRLAWARLQGLPIEKVGAAFFYASTGETVRPADDLDEAALVALVTGIG